MPASNYAITILGHSFLLWGRWTPALAAHESHHAERQIAVGRMKWHWLYTSSRDFRLAEELGAYKESVKYGENIDFCARQLSAWYYFLDISCDDALNMLKG